MIKTLCCYEQMPLIKWIIWGELKYVGIFERNEKGLCNTPVCTSGELIGLREGITPLIINVHLLTINHSMSSSTFSSLFFCRIEIGKPNMTNYIIHWRRVLILESGSLDKSSSAIYYVLEFVQLRFVFQNI